MLRESWSWLGQRPWVLLVVALVLGAAVIVACQGDFVPADPLWYADQANHFAEDLGTAFTNIQNHPFQMRIGLTLPLALIYRLFGVTTLTTNLPCLLAALGILCVAYAAGPTPRAKALGLLFGLACPALFRETYLLNVDLPCAALMACSVLFLSRSDRPRGSWWLVAAVIVWMFAFLVKENAVWCIPVWIYAIARDVRAEGTRATLRRYAPALLVGAALAIGYLGLCAKYWGDPLARFHGVEELTGGHNWSMNDAPAMRWVRRLTTQPAVLLWRMSYLVLVPALLSPWLVKGRDRIWLVATASMVLLFWFGTTSFARYSPLPTIPRMVLPALPFMIVLGALAADRAIERMAGWRGRTAVVAAFLVAVTVPAMISIAGIVARPRPEHHAFVALREKLAAHPVVLVCGDPRCPSITGFEFGFVPPPDLTIVFATQYTGTPIPAGATILVMVNRNRGPNAEWATPTTYDVHQITALELPVVLADHEVTLYDAGDGKRLRDALRDSH